MKNKLLNKQNNILEFLDVDKLLEEKSRKENMTRQETTPVDS